jgi:hypothetical protein
MIKSLTKARQFVIELSKTYFYLKLSIKKVINEFRQKKSLKMDGEQRIYILSLDT